MQIPRDYETGSRYSRGGFDLADLDGRIAALAAGTQTEGFWNDSRQAQRLMRQLAGLRSTYNGWNDMLRLTQDLAELAELAATDGATDSDNELATGIEAEYKMLAARLEKMELELQLAGEYDARPAILSVKSGAGGVDAQDWAELLVRMYSRWSEQCGFGLELLDEMPGDEAGIKSATLRIDGLNAYGFLRTERGVHRLIRLSPFNANHRRHTSFALVEVLPEPDEDQKLEIHADDLRYEFFRASGHGGQNVQKNSTAVRITHIPSGIVVSVQNERSQLQNREVALKILHARLTDREIRRKAEARQVLKGEHVSAEFGRQVRSYFLHPYQLVKDHRTEYQETDTANVLDGNLDGFLRASLLAAVGTAGNNTVEV